MFDRHQFSQAFAFIKPGWHFPVIIDLWGWHVPIHPVCDVLAWAEAPGLYWALRNDPNFWFGGKTIVGGLLGGWMGIELAKKIMGVTISTGDVCVYPILLGMCIGRVGCFLTGLSDNTCGVRTTLPWGVDYGDGIPRHPAQIYEILFLLGLAAILHIFR